MAGIEGLEGRLIPPALIIQEYFSKEQKAIDDLEAQAETLNAAMDELREEQGGEEGYFGDLEKINRASVNGKLRVVNGELGMVNCELKMVNEEHSQFTIKS